MQMEDVPFVGPVKHSLTIAGHATSLSLEPIFWQALTRCAAGEGLSVSALVTQVDGARLSAARPPNLASALRSFLMAKMIAAADLGMNKAQTVAAEVIPPDSPPPSPPGAPSHLGS